MMVSSMDTDRHPFDANFQKSMNSIQGMLEKVMKEQFDQQSERLRCDLQQDMRQLCVEMARRCRGGDTNSRESNSLESSPPFGSTIASVNQAYDLVPGMVRETPSTTRRAPQFIPDRDPTSGLRCAEEFSPTSGDCKGSTSPRTGPGSNGGGSPSSSPRQGKVQSGKDAQVSSVGKALKGCAITGSTVLTTDMDLNRPEPPTSPMSPGGKAVRPKAVMSLPGKIMKSATRNLTVGNRWNRAEDDESILRIMNMTGIRGLISRVVTSAQCELFIAGLIVINSVMLGVVVNYMATNDDRSVPEGFRIAETMFCMIFTVELAARMYVVGIKSFFMGPEWHWNTFDFTIVGMQFIDEVLSLAGLTAMPQNLSFARVVKLLKMVRVVRVARVARVLRELRTLVASIVGSMKSLFWVGLLFLLMIYMLAIMLTQAVADHHRSHGITSYNDEALQFFYGNLAQSMLSLFQAITSGVDWNDMTRPLTDEISPAFALLFVVYVGFSSMCLMNVVTGVFVDSVMMRARSDREQFLVRNATDILGGTGEMNLEQFLSKVDTPEMQEFFKGIDANVSEAARLFSVVDVDDSGWIDAEEFLSGCVRLQGPAKALDTAVLVQGVHNLGREVAKIARKTGAVLSSDSL